MNILMGIWEKNSLYIPLPEPKAIFKILLMKKKKRIKEEIEEKKKRKKTLQKSSCICVFPWYTLFYEGVRSRKVDSFARYHMTLSGKAMADNE